MSSDSLTAEPPRWELPPHMRRETVLRFDTAAHDLYAATVALLRRVGVGDFPVTAGGLARLEDFVVEKDLFRNFKARAALYRAVGDDTAFLATYEAFLCGAVLPFLKLRLKGSAEAVAAEGPSADGEEAATGRRDASSADGALTFYCQVPPTVRLQSPGPSHSRTHSDDEYGHQTGEINFWLPLTDHSLTRTALWVESSPGAGDYHPLDLGYGEAAVFHGTLCRHFAPPNGSACTRVSLDFRIGIGGYFDPDWALESVRAQHTRKAIRL